MFRPANDACKSCGKAVHLMEAQQLVPERKQQDFGGVWRRQHQRCFDLEQKMIENKEERVEPIVKAHAAAS